MGAARTPPPRWAALFTALWLILSAGPAAAQPAGGGILPGANYRELSEPQPVEVPEGTVEVIEFLWYDCQTCFVVEPAIERWLEQQGEAVTLRRVPAVAGTHMVHLARAFYAAEMLGVLDRLHPALYDAIHRHGRDLGQEDALAAFFAEQGIDRRRFLSAFRSSAVSARVRQAQQMSRRYEIAGAPTFVVAGRYRLDPTMAASAAAMVEILDHLVGREHPP